MTITGYGPAMAPTRPEHPGEEISWSGWGDPARAEPLPEGFGDLLRQTLGLRPGPGAPASPDALALEPSRLTAEVEAELGAIVGDGQVHTEHEWRARHRGGKSTIDLLALRTGRTLPAPDAVLTPGSHEEVLAVLERCSARRVAVVPFGGGTSVVGGLSPETAGFAAVVALGVRRLDALLEVDDESRLAVLEPGLRGPEAEALLAPHGYTLGHFPQSYEYATLGGFAATRSSGQSSAGYGRFDDRVMALRLATPVGAMQLGRAPKSAAGPDLRQLVLGSEGTLGVITALTLALHPAPERRLYEGWRLPGFAAGTAALRRLAQDGPPADRAAAVRRGRDRAGARPARPQAAGEGGGPAAGCLAIVGWEGRPADVARRRDAAAEVLRAAGGEPVPGAGEGWARGPVPRALPARRAARRRRAGGDAGDGHVLVRAAAALRGGLRCGARQR